MQENGIRKRVAMHTAKHMCVVAAVFTKNGAKSKQRKPVKAQSYWLKLRKPPTFHWQNDDASGESASATILTSSAPLHRLPSVW